MREGYLCTVNGKLIISGGKLCLAEQYVVDITIVGNQHGRNSAVTCTIPNGDYEVIYLSGAINFYEGGDGAWDAGNCYYIDGISSGGGGAPLPGISHATQFQTYEDAENAAKGMSSIITISNGGISMYFDDGYVGDNTGEITYRLTKIS